MKTKFSFGKWLRSRNGRISIVGALLVLIMLAVIWGRNLSGLAGTSGLPAELPSGANCLPTCDVTDGRMFTIATNGLQTLAGQSIFVKVAAPAEIDSFVISIFDGDTSNTWDQGSTPLVYTLLADPTRNQTGTEPVGQWMGESMANNAWTDITISQDSRAQSPGGDYFYLLRVDLPNADTTTKIGSSFKIRSNSPIELATNQSFAYMVPLSPANVKIIYPAHPDLTTTTFDGTWDMYLNVPVAQESFAIYDGDFDHGSYDCSVNDADDSDTANDTDFSWVVPGSNVAEGIATSTLGCVNDAKQAITGPEGQAYASGAPADNSLGSSYRREPAVIYDVITPDGSVYHNGNPSGNMEWEQFLISSDRSVAADYYIDGLLPAGIYKVHVTGLDLSNLNAWHLTYDITCVYADGTPCIPVLHPYKIGDLVWEDTNGNGTQEDGEKGIQGVTLTLLDSAGYPVPNGTTTTDANGNYSFKVEPGTYTVQIDPQNFEVEGALVGYVSTTAGGNAQTNTVTDANILTYDFGYNAASASLGDFVWNDSNGNGIQDSGEAGVEGVTVNLFGSDGATVVATTTTDAAGNYSFTGLAAGTYYVQVLAPDGKAFATVDAGDDAADSDVDASGRTAAITLGAGETNTTVDAGLKDVLSCAANNLVLNPSFEENKGSPPKKWTNGAAGTVGVPVVDGKYAGYINGSKVMSQSVNVTAGSSYTLTFYSGSHNPKNQTVKIQYFKADGKTAIGTAATHTITSDLENTGFGGPYTLMLGPAPSDAASLKIMVSANNYDYAKVDKLCMLAEIPPATAAIGDLLWNDVNRNGIQDGGEAGMADIAVNLLGSDGLTVLAATTTDAAGIYSFTELLPGTYYVQVVAPAETSFTKANAGDDSADSDVDPATGKTAAINLGVGEINNSIDAGLKESLALSCPGNLVLNPSFELNSGSPPRDWKNGTAGNVGVWVDGKNVGYISGSKVMSQSVSVTPGSSYTLTFYSGSHVPSIQTVKLQYFNAGGTAIGMPVMHTIVDDLEIVGFGGPYSLALDPAPAEAASLQILVSANGKDYAKVDSLCLQATTPPAEPPTPVVPMCTAGNTYKIENTTNSPFYSVKFEFASGTEVKNGSYDIFKYTLPASVVTEMTSMQIEAKASGDSRVYTLACNFAGSEACAPVGDDAFSVAFSSAADNGDGTYTLTFKVYVYGEHGLSHAAFSLPEGQTAGGLTGNYVTETCE